MENKTLSECICSWLFLYCLGSKCTFPDSTQENLELDGMLVDGNFSKQKIIDIKSEKDIKWKIKEIECEISQNLENNLYINKNNIEEELSYLKTHLLELHDPAGRLRNMQDKGCKNHRDAVTQRKKRFLKIIDKMNNMDEFSRHIKEKIVGCPEGLVYRSDERWIIE